MLPTPVYITAAAGFFLGIQFGPSIAALNAIFMGLVAWAINGFRLTSEKEKVTNTRNTPPATTSSPGVFIIKSRNDSSLSITEYGQAVTDWACDDFPSSMRAILKSPDQSLLMERIRESPFSLELQLIALHSAIYWVYALSVCKAPVSITDDLKKGLEIGLTKLRDSYGEPFDQGLKEFFLVTFKSYLSAQTMCIDDYEEYYDLVSVSFIHKLSQVYQVNPEQIDITTRTYLGGIVDTLTPEYLTMLKDDLGISFRK